MKLHSFYEIDLRNCLGSTLIEDILLYRKMWSPVVSPPDVSEDKIPVSRSKHATVLHGQCLYLLGGRNGNLPMKDFWKYCIGKIFAQYWFYVCRFNLAFSIPISFH